jgi:hypothetical protein
VSLVLGLLGSGAGCGLATSEPDELSSEISFAPDAVLEWNANALVGTAVGGTVVESRTLAIVHIAMHDALNSIRPRYHTYAYGARNSNKASLDAALAAAAHDTLVARVVAAKVPGVEAAYAEALARIPDGQDKDDGIAAGRAAAAAILALRAADPPFDFGPYTPGPNPGDYQFTPGFTFAAGTKWGDQPLFSTSSSSLYAVAPPYVLTSADYAADYDEVKAIGQDTSTTRTAEETEIARFWYEDSPKGWNRIARTYIMERRLNGPKAARVLAGVHIAMADGFIAGFKAKYQYNFWRPVTAIPAGATDGNDATIPDATWSPLCVTPPIPDHPSTHSVLGAAAATVLTAHAGDDYRFSTTSGSLPGTSRSFSSFQAAADENANSRVLCGIHFRFATIEGLRQGRAIGAQTAALLAEQ